MRFIPPLMRGTGFCVLGFSVAQLSPWLGVATAAVVLILAAADVETKEGAKG